MLYARTLNAVIILKRAGKILLKAVGIKVPVIRGIIVIIVAPISWRLRGLHFIENSFQEVK
jgi:hypothetical protein